MPAIGRRVATSSKPRRDYSAALCQLRKFLPVLFAVDRQSLFIGFEQTTSELLVEGIVTHCSVYLRAAECAAVGGKRDADNPTARRVVSESDIDALPVDCFIQLRSTATGGESRPHRVIDTIPNAVFAPQPIPPNFLLAIGNMQPVFLRQFATNFCTSAAVITVADGAPVVVDAVGDNMQVRMCGISMSADDILRVHNPHTLHILTRNLGHQTVRQMRFVLNGKVERDMIDGIRQLPARLVIRLSLHTDGDSGIAV